MAKKKSRKPNLSNEALERARRELRGEVSAPPTPPIESGASGEQARPTRPVKQEKRQQDVVYSVKKTMTREELANEYGYIIRDLTSMATLAVILFVAMVAVSLVIDQIA